MSKFPKSTIAASESRVIKNEMKTLGRNYKKILADATKARMSAHKEFRHAKLQWERTIKRIDKVVARATKGIERRMAILEGRL